MEEKVRGEALRDMLEYRSGTHDSLDARGETITEESRQQARNVLHVLPISNPCASAPRLL